METLGSASRDSKLQSQFRNFSSKEKSLPPKYMSSKVHELTLRENVGVFWLYFVTLSDARWYHILLTVGEHIARLEHM